MVLCDIATYSVHLHVWVQSYVRRDKTSHTVRLAPMLADPYTHIHKHIPTLKYASICMYHIYTSVPVLFEFDHYTFLLVLGMGSTAKGMMWCLNVFQNIHKQ